MTVRLPVDVKFPAGAVVIWVLYERPRDYPSGYVLRPQFTGPGGTIVASESAWGADNPDELRKILPPGLVRLARHPDDDKCIVETWL